VRGGRRQQFLCALAEEKAREREGRKGKKRAPCFGSDETKRKKREKKKSVFSSKGREERGSPLSSPRFTIKRGKKQKGKEWAEPEFAQLRCKSPQKKRGGKGKKAFSDVNGEKKSRRKTKGTDVTPKGKKRKKGGRSHQNPFASFAIRKKEQTRGGGGGDTNRSSTGEKEAPAVLP